MILINERQLEAICSINGKIKVVAGAGSGKTKTLTLRYLKLVSLGVSPNDILCMTFSNKAALEMKTRIYEFIDHKIKLDYICTIHSFCLRFLYHEIERIGYSREFSIIDENDLMNVLKKLLVNYFSSDEKVQDIDLKIVTKWYDDYKKFKDENEYIKEDKREGNEIFWKLVDWQRMHNSLSFDDLIHFTIYIVKNFSECLDIWKTRFKYVMVDEAQDCNEDDWTIIEALSGNGNLFIVGDPDQCIYEWRGSKPKIFNTFLADKTIILNQNYRSTKNILSIANNVIMHNRERIPKDLFTDNEYGFKAQLYYAQSQWMEAKWIVTKIKDIISNGQASYGDFAILYRSQYAAKMIYDFLYKNNLHTMNIGGLQFFEIDEVKLIVAVMKVIEFFDLISLEKVLRLLIPKISMSQIESIESRFEESRDISDLEMIEEIDLSEIVNKFNSVISKKSSLYKISDYAKTIAEVFLKNRIESQKVKNHIRELLFKISEYETYNPQDELEVSSREWLRDIMFQSDDIYDEMNDSKIKLMSIHLSKGLEFPYVFVVGLNEGTFPNFKSLKERKLSGEEEERRLMYVACTRAKEMLFLTSCGGYNYSMHCNNVLSRFLMEIDLDNIKLVDCDYDIYESFDASRKLIDIYKIGFSSKISIGDIVTHRPSGLQGEVDKIDEEKSIVYVRFFKDNKLRKMKKSVLDKDY